MPAELGALCAIVGLIGLVLALACWLYRDVLFGVEAPRDPFESTTRIEEEAERDAARRVVR